MKHVPSCFLLVYGLRNVVSWEYSKPFAISGLQMESSCFLPTPSPSRSYFKVLCRSAACLLYMRMMSNEPAFALFYIMGRDVLSSPVLLFFCCCCRCRCRRCRCRCCRCCCCCCCCCCCFIFLSSHANITWSPIDSRTTIFLCQFIFGQNIWLPVEDHQSLFDHAGPIYNRWPIIKKFKKSHWKITTKQPKNHPWVMGLVYLPAWMADFYGKNVGIYGCFQK